MLTRIPVYISLCILLALDRGLNTHTHTLSLTPNTFENYLQICCFESILKASQKVCGHFSLLQYIFILRNRVRKLTNLHFSLGPWARSSHARSHLRLCPGEGNWTLTLDCCQQQSNRKYSTWSLPALRWSTWSRLPPLDDLLLPGNAIVAGLPTFHKPSKPGQASISRVSRMT